MVEAPFRVILGLIAGIGQESSDFGSRRRGPGRRIGDLVVPAGEPPEVVIQRDSGRRAHGERVFFPMG